MEWPDWVTAHALFPAFSQEEQEGAVPVFSLGEPAWSLLDPESTNGLKSQLMAVINAYSEPTQDPTMSGATVDESQGPVVVHANATVEPSAHFIGPCLVESGASIRHGAYVRPHAWICSGSVVGPLNRNQTFDFAAWGKSTPLQLCRGIQSLGCGVNLGRRYKTEATYETMGGGSSPSL